MIWRLGFNFVARSGWALGLPLHADAAAEGRHLCVGDIQAVVECD
jgi:hypothetical protein